jgi:hypothetical protein
MFVILLRSGNFSLGAEKGMVGAACMGLFYCSNTLCTANNFGIMYSRKRISQNSFPNFIYIFPKSFMIFCQELQDPKRNYENQILTQAAKDVIMKKTSHPRF